MAAGVVFVALLCTGLNGADASWLAGGSGTAAMAAGTVPAGTAPGTSLSGRDVTVTWPAVTLSDASVRYTVRRYNAGTSALQTILSACTGSVAALTCTENTVPAGSWKYSVQPVVGTWTGAESAKSGTVTTPPPAPTGVTATAATSSTINLSWTAAAGATSYQVWRSGVSGGPYTQIGTPSGTTYGDSGLSPTTTYYYVVKAVFSGAASAASIETSATTPVAVVTNAGFESGSLASWTSTPAPSPNGTTAAVTSGGSMGAHGGSYFGIVYPGAMNTYSHLSQSFHANPGDTISGWAFFKTDDYQPYNDDGAIVIQQNGSDIATLFASSVGAVGDYGGTGWTSWTYTFTSSGTFTLDARVRNITDGGGASYIGIDDITGTVAP